MDVVAVFLQEPAGITAGDAVLFQVIGDVVDLFLFIEGFRNDGQFLRADAFDFQERCGSFSSTAMVSLPKAATTRWARAGPMPLTAPLPRKRSMPSTDSGMMRLQPSAANWRP